MPTAAPTPAEAAPLAASRLADRHPVGPEHEVVTRIRPPAPGFGVDLAELWQYRHLFAALVWRNVRIEFDATRLGSIWAVARPVLFTLVFVLFRGFSGANTRVDLPYALYVFSGLVLWTYFLDAATSSAGAIRVDSALLTKVYYPRLLTPLVPVVAALISIGIAAVPLIGMMVWFGVHPGWQLILLPLVLVQAMALSLGVGTIISSMSIENRDWERALAFILSVGLWMSPVIYAPSMIPEPFSTLYHLNPMVGVLLSFRAALFDGFPLPAWEWGYSWLCTLAILAVGIWAFRRSEASLADRL
ncbi:MAG: ABC transporter permease [Chloroflexi bacterium]|nr:ABC transporter permease [Chloroflexota bacterium]